MPCHLCNWPGRRHCTLAGSTIRADFSGIPMIRVANALVASGLATLISLGPTALRANPPLAAPNLPSITVHFGDLNLDDAQSVSRLYRRIEAAAVKLCSPVAVGGPEIDAKDYHRCVSDAVERAVTTLDRPGLSAYYRLRVARLMAAQPH
jgi:UrcA family protein